MNTISFALISPNYMSKQAAIKRSSSPSYSHWSTLLSPNPGNSNLLCSLRSIFLNSVILPVYVCMCVCLRRSDTLIGEIPLSRSLKSDSLSKALCVSEGN